MHALLDLSNMSSGGFFLSLRIGPYLFQKKKINEKNNLVWLELRQNLRQRNVHRGEKLS